MASKSDYNPNTICVKPSKSSYNPQYNTRIGPEKRLQHPKQMRIGTSKAFATPKTHVYWHLKSDYNTKTTLVLGPCNGYKPMTEAETRSTFAA